MPRTKGIRSLPTRSLSEIAVEFMARISIEPVAMRPSSKVKIERETASRHGSAPDDRPPQHGKQRCRPPAARSCHVKIEGGVVDRDLKQADDPCRVIEIVARAGQLYATLWETPYCDCTRYSKSAYAVQLG